MILFPVSTDVHDGKIRLAAIEIMSICVLVHVLVTMDMANIKKEMAVAEKEFNTFQQEYLEKNPPGSIEELMKLVENPPEEILKAHGQYEARMKSLKESALLYKLAFIPANFSVLSLFTALFVHGGWMHLIGNLIFFYVCGVAMEKYWGFWRFIIIYLVCGMGANLFYMASTLAIPEVADVPLVGASGAIAVAMGAFVTTHMRVKVKIFYLFFWIRGTFRIPGYLYFGFWFLSDLFNAVVNAGESSGVAYTAHVSGFMLGALMGVLFRSESVASRIHRRITSQPRPELQMHTEDLSKMYPEIGNTASPYQKHIPLSVIGWQAFHQEDYATAVDSLSRAMNNYFQSPETHRAQITENVSHILQFADRLRFPAPQMYQWAKQLSELDLSEPAIACYDIAAQAEDNPHIRKNSLLNASMQRIRIGKQQKRARSDLKALIELDPDGIHGQQAEQILRYLQGEVKTAEELAKSEEFRSEEQASK